MSLWGHCNGSNQSQSKATCPVLVPKALLKPGALGHLVPQWLIQLLILLASAAFSAAQGKISPGEPTALLKRCCSFQGQETSRLSKHFSEPARATVRNFNWKQVRGWLAAEKGSQCSLHKPWWKDVQSVRGKERGHEVCFSKEEKGRESRGSVSSLQCFNVIMKVYYF